MLLDLEKLVIQHHLEVDTVLHIGAHLGQEAEIYERLGATSVTWVEANPQVVPLLRRNVEPLGHRVLSALATDRSGDIVDFHITNNEQSSSVLPLGTHRYEHPEVVVTESVQLTTITLDDLCASSNVSLPNLIVLDVQGAEILVLRGAERVMAAAESIYAEVNERPLYAGGALLPEFDSFLSARGFDRVEMTLTIHGWGDALYVKRDSAVAITQDESLIPFKIGSEMIRDLRSRAGLRVRSLVSSAVAPRFDAMAIELDQLAHRMSVIEQMLVRSELEYAAMRQQLDECLDYLRIQHAIVRDVLEEVKPLLGTKEGPH